jgi:hypothetical protein
MRKIALCLALVALLGLSGQAMAVVGAIDAVPAATLLIPYFEVDLDDPFGRTTLFSINNASQAPIIAHVTLWTDLSIPTLDFDVFLTGFDVYTINLRDLFTTGFTPPTRTGNLPTTPNSPRGPFSATTPGYLNTAGCLLPLPNVPAPLLDHIRRAHTGLSSPIFGGACSGVNYPDNVARGYITVDTVSRCTVRFPNSLAYWQEDALDINQLWGDIFYIDLGANDAAAIPAVHVEAGVGEAGDYTFYGRYSGGLDDREALASTWGARYFVGGAFDGETFFQVWRDAKVDPSPFVCAAGPPAPFPLVNHQLVSFDEQENPDVAPPGDGFSPPIVAPPVNPFPWETQKVLVGGLTFPVPFTAGWVYMNLNTEVAGQFLAPGDDRMQNHVSVIHRAEDRFQIGLDAMHFDNVTSPATAEDICLGLFPPGATPCP